MTSCLEEWRDIPGYEGRYQASNMGRIRSVDEFVRCGKGGKGSRLKKGRVLRPAGQKKDPHLRVVLGHGASGVCVHNLVVLAFIGPRPRGADIRHLDGNPLNNRVDNLAYGTRTENILDVFRVGKAWRKLTAEKALEIKKRLQAGEIGVVLAREYGVSQSTVSAIKRGVTFAWL